jgi:hypothetical protein
VDTSLPVIDLLGPNPKVFKVCKCGGLKGIMGGPNANAGGDQLCREQRKRYESSIRVSLMLAFPACFTVFALLSHTNFTFAFFRHRR